VEVEWSEDRKVRVWKAVWISCVKREREREDLNLNEGGK
jgi:hypothetical protein